MPKWLRWTLIGVGGFLLLSVLAALISGGDDNENPEVADSTVATDRETSTTEAAVVTEPPVPVQCDREQETFDPDDPINIAVLAASPSEGVRVVTAETRDATDGSGDVEVSVQICSDALTVEELEAVFVEIAQVVEGADTSGVVTRLGVTSYVPGDDGELTDDQVAIADNFQGVLWDTEQAATFVDVTDR